MIGRVESAVRVGKDGQVGTIESREHPRNGGRQLGRGKALSVEEAKVLRRGVAGEAARALQSGGWLGVRDQVLVELVLATGLRRAEVAGLDVEDLHLAGRDAEGWFLVVRCGKGGRRREVPVGSRVRGLVRGFLKWRREREGCEASGPLFRSERGGRLTPNGVWRIWKGACRRAGVGRRGLGVHGGRHRFALDCLDQGASLLDVQGLLGHADLRTTQVYVQAPWCRRVAVVAGL